LSHEKPHIFVCIPAINERDYLPKTLDCLALQDDISFSVSVCVNQPDAWWEDPAQREICNNNADTLKMLQQRSDLKLHIIDRSSKGRGWDLKDSGVGRARRCLIDETIKSAKPDDIIVSLDADTTFDHNYLSSVRETLALHTKASALSVPYYHLLTGDSRANRAILRYEIYMRNYAINLHRIQCPYNFTALGSAMALRVSTYRKIGGITPKKSGEDFYFLQKLRKFGPILNYNSVKVHPAARFSNRVFFGTGPAMIKGDSGDWESYPIYSYRLFDLVGKTIRQFPALFEEDAETPMTGFLQEIFKSDDLWSPLRANFPERDQFIRACHEKADALRILQFLKTKQKEIPGSDEEHLRAFFAHHYPEALSLISQDFSFASSPIETLDAIRNFLFETEDRIQKEGDQRIG
jgi:glycosyltransferase involved in cell wall biosynthesis